MIELLCPLVLGFVLDLCFGDPRFMPHPVVAMGKLIRWLEPRLRGMFPKSPQGEAWAGGALAVLLPCLSFIAAFAAIRLSGLVSPWLALAVETFFCYQILATKDLKVESMAVYRALKQGDLPGAREAVGRIVGRDTQTLDAPGVTRAAVETVAENTSDGVVAPMLFLALGGAPLGMLYKAVNTMDSMVGYKNQRYLHFGRAPAKLDDAANYLPSRLAGLLTVLSALLLGLDGRGAWRIFRRDSRNHASPNSAQTEAACAGALGVRLAGDAVYFGEVVHKPTIGDAKRPIEPEDIVRANRLLYAVAFFCLLLCVGIRFLVGRAV